MSLGSWLNCSSMILSVSSGEEAMSVDSLVGSTVGGAVGAAMAGLRWNRMKKNAAVAAMVAQVVLMRGFRVWES